MFETLKSIIGLSDRGGNEIQPKSREEIEADLETLRKDKEALEAYFGRDFVASDRKKYDEIEIKIRELENELALLS